MSIAHEKKGADNLSAVSLLYSRGFGAPRHLQTVSTRQLPDYVASRVQRGQQHVCRFARGLNEPIPGLPSVPISMSGTSSLTAPGSMPAGAATSRTALGRFAGRGVTCRWDDRAAHHGDRSGVIVRHRAGWWCISTSRSVRVSLHAADSCAPWSGSGPCPSGAPCGQASPRIPVSRPSAATSSSQPVRVRQWQPAIVFYEAAAQPCGLKMEVDGLRR